MVVVMFPEPVPFAQEIFGAIGDAMVGGEVICSLVVFEHSSVDRGSL